MSSFHNSNATNQVKKGIQSMSSMLDHLPKPPDDFLEEEEVNRVKKVASMSKMACSVAEAFSVDKDYLSE
jgi:hypothetical protein